MTRRASCAPNPFWDKSILARLRRKSASESRWSTVSRVGGGNAEEDDDEDELVVFGGCLGAVGSGAGADAVVIL